LYPTSSHIPSGKLIPIFCSSPLTEIPKALYLDRYIQQNQGVVSRLNEERLALKLQLDTLQAELRSCVDTNFSSIQVPKLLLGLG
jgi:hypothetical protein